MAVGITQEAVLTIGELPRRSEVTFETPPKVRNSEANSVSLQRSKRSSLSSISCEGAKLERILAEKKLELLKRAKERKLTEDRLRIDNEIAEAKDAADLYSSYGRSMV